MGDMAVYVRQCPNCLTINRDIDRCVDCGVSLDEAQPTKVPWQWWWTPPPPASDDFDDRHPLLWFGAKVWWGFILLTMPWLPIGLWGYVIAIALPVVPMAAVAYRDRVRARS